MGGTGGSWIPASWTARLSTCEVLSSRNVLNTTANNGRRQRPWLPDQTLMPRRVDFPPTCPTLWSLGKTACLTYCELTPDRYKYAPRPAIRYKIWPSNNQLNGNSPTSTRPPVHPVVCSLFQIPRRQDSETNVLDSRGLAVWLRFLVLCGCLYPWDCLGCRVTVNLLLCLD